MTNAPLRLVSVEIIQQCNNRCPYCDQPKSGLFMPAAQFSHLLDELATEGAEAVALGGGEPTLHPALPDMILAVRKRGLRAGLTTNACNPRLVMHLADQGLLESFGVSAGKGKWLDLVPHPRAIVNLLMLRDSLKEILHQAAKAMQGGAQRFLLLGYKGDRVEFRPSTVELSDAYRMLNILGRKYGLTVAADDYTRRRLGLTTTCGDGFLRVRLDGTREPCCFQTCEFRYPLTGTASLKA
ncbi:MAG: radical SAM protein [Thermodesulfobacteriota bacterium]